MEGKNSEALIDAPPPAQGMEMLVDGDDYQAMEIAKQAPYPLLLRQ